MEVTNPSQGGMRIIQIADLQLAIDTTITQAEGLVDLLVVAVPGCQVNDLIVQSCMIQWHKPVTGGAGLFRCNSTGTADLRVQPNNNNSLESREQPVGQTVVHRIITGFWNVVAAGDGEITLRASTTDQNLVALDNLTSMRLIHLRP